MHPDSLVEFVQSEKVRKAIKETNSLDEVYSIFQTEYSERDNPSLSATLVIEYKILPTDYLFESIPSFMFDDYQHFDEIRVQEGVKTIKHHAFDYTDIGELYLPKSLEYIETLAMPARYGKIYYAGTAKEFNGIEKADIWTFGPIVIQCTDEVLPIWNRV